jgi:DNA-binding protein Fis
MTDSVIVQRQSELVSIIQNTLPDFVKACAANADMVVLHQDACAAAYQEDEYALLGMVIKYAGMCGKEVRVIGVNRQTVRERNKIH